MKAIVDKEGCIGCGLCPNVCPEVYKMGSDDKAEVYVNPIPLQSQGCAKDAAEQCPVSAIKIE